MYQCHFYLVALQTSLENLTNTQLPCVFVATHNDLPQVEQKYHTQPEQFIEQHGLMPAKVCSKFVHEKVYSFHPVPMHKY